MALFDLHMHTRPFSPDSTMTANEAIEAALLHELDGIVLTEHNVLRNDLKDLGTIAQGRITVLVGVEVNCAEGHYLAYGLTDDAAIEYGMPASALVDIVRGANGAIAVAHPYRWEAWQGEYCRELDLDAVEVDSINTEPEAGRKARALALDIGARSLTSSDAHSAEAIGDYWTEVPDGIVTMESLVSFLRRGH